MRTANVQVIVLSGFLRQLRPKTLSRFQHRVLNVHAALLPKFGGKGMYGRRVHEAVLAAREKVPGAALALVQNGRVALTRAYGQRHTAYDLYYRLIITSAAQFAICSITKSFTATALALLHHEGQLDRSKPARDYMPEFLLSDPVATERVGPHWLAGLGVGVDIR
jgi:CubicO group peptidase (beta-lactamase class C family)